PKRAPPLGTAGAISAGAPAAASGSIRIIRPPHTPPPPSHCLRGGPNLPNAAHPPLPLNSLARVTNLANGRSVVVRVTDRGPVADSLLIDVSPRAADELRMKEDGA